MFKDYYAILDINQSAILSEIKSAYKIQALKWHPDKNQDEDTTERMKEINEAKLILIDEEARIRYDREYLKFKSFQKNKEKENKSEKQKEQKSSRKEPKQKEKTKKPKDPLHSTYQFDDEILKRWMENARKQAIRNVYEMINEFRDSSLIGFGTFFKTALMVIIMYIIYSIIARLLI
tara:strand:+ start:625 stop:1155 length:531 start_codon:yes stop_codon:yes gene_type:complete